MLRISSLLSTSQHPTHPHTHVHTQAPRPSREGVPAWEAEPSSVGKGSAYSRPMRGGGHEQESRPSCRLRPKSEPVDSASSLPPLQRAPILSSNLETSPSVCPKNSLTHYSSAEIHTAFVRIFPAHRQGD